MRYVFALFLCFTLTGCITDVPKTSVAMGKIPKLKKIDRPQLVSITAEELAPLAPDVKKKVTDRNDSLMLYAKEMEVELQAYDRFQELWNNMADQWLDRNVKTTTKKGE